MWPHKPLTHYLLQTPSTHTIHLEEASLQLDTVRVALGVHQELYIPIYEHRSCEPLPFERCVYFELYNEAVRVFGECRECAFP